MAKKKSLAKMPNVSKVPKIVPTVSKKNYKNGQKIVPKNVSKALKSAVSTV